MNYRQFALAFTAAALVASSGPVAMAQSNNLEPNQSDKSFVVNALKANHAEVRAAAQNRNSADPKVRAFAALMIRDHLSAISQIAAYADHRNIPYPKTLVNKAGEGSDLSAVPAADSKDIKEKQTGHVAVGSKHTAMAPRAYMVMEVTAHKAAIAMFQEEAKNGADQQLKVLVGNLLPIVQGHLAMAEAYVAGKPMPMPSQVPNQNMSQPAKPPRG